MKKAGKTINIFAILALIFAFIFAPLGIVFGFMALHQIKKKSQKGKGLAIAGIILGIIFVFFGILLFILIFSFANLVQNMDENCDISNNVALQEFVGQNIPLGEYHNLTINYSGKNKKISSNDSIKIESFRLRSGFDLPAYILLKGIVIYQDSPYEFETILAYATFNESTNSRENIVTIDAFSKAFSGKDLRRDFNCS